MPSSSLPLLKIKQEHMTQQRKQYSKRKRHSMSKQHNAAVGENNVVEEVTQKQYTGGSIVTKKELQQEVTQLKKTTQHKN